MKVSLGPRPFATCRRHYASSSRPPIISIIKGTFYRHHPSAALSIANPALFENLDFEIQSAPEASGEHWAIIGPSSSGKTTFCQILRGQHLCFPPRARTYPFLTLADGLKTRIPSKAIQYVGFSGEEGGMGGHGTRGAYLSARYESRRENTDFSVLDYLQGHTELNPSDETPDQAVSVESLDRVITDLRLGDLVNMPVSNLSNGQTRRARIAKALLRKPEVLLLDEPFMGLDPPTLMSLSPMLHGLAEARNPRLLLMLRPQDPVPEWITHLIFLKSECEVALQGKKDEVLRHLPHYIGDLSLHSLQEVGRTLTRHGISQAEVSVGQGSPSQHSAESAPLSREGFPLVDSHVPAMGEPLVEMEGARVAYGSKTVLGNWSQEVDGERKDGLWWTVRRGQRWGIFGPNGSGKTTILSLICSDHPQTYSLPIRLFGRSRLPQPGQPGISIFDIQTRIGHSSPEIQSFMPRYLTLRKVLENAWSETFLGQPKLDDVAKAKVDACLKWFEPELKSGSSEENLKWADDLLYGALPFSAQRIALFLRAIVKHPDLVILDEAFSGMDDALRDKCLLFLAHGENKTFAYTTDTENGSQEQRSVVDSEVSKRGEVLVGGLKEQQALLCISHVKEEIPGCVREWICLPEANSGEAARFGRLRGPIEGDYKRWNEIWGVES